MNAEIEDERHSGTGHRRSVDEAEQEQRKPRQRKDRDQAPLEQLDGRVEQPDASVQAVQRPADRERESPGVVRRVSCGVCDGGGPS